MKKSLYLLSFLFISFFQICNGQLPTNGLVAYYSFCNSTNDFSANNYNLSNSNAILTSDRFNNFNSAYRFNGNSVLSLNDPFPLVNDFTYSCWFNADTTQFGTVLINGNTQLNGYGIIIGDGSNNYAGDKVVVVCGNISYFGGETITMHAWHHAVLSHTGNLFTFYLDTVLIGTYNVPFNAPNGAFNIGRNQMISSNGFFGSIDEIVVYDRVLTFAEIKQLYDFKSNPEIVTQPITQSIQLGQTVQYSVIATGGGTITYQWQQNSGTGFVNLFDAGNYSGVTTNMLSISNVSSSLNNTIYRCVISNQYACADTSQQATLSVITSVDDIELYKALVIPNPSNGNFSICLDNINNKRIIHLIIKNALGQTVYNKMGTVEDNKVFVMSDLVQGIYFYQISDNKDIIISKGKLMIGK